MSFDRPDSADTATSLPTPRQGGRWRFVLSMLRAGCISYLILLVLMMWLENLLVYPTWQIPPGDWNPTEFAFEEARFHSTDGTSLHGWYLAHPAPKAYVLYCHGNGEDVARLGEYMAVLRDRHQISILAFDYRGYGLSEGRPGEAGIVADTLAAQQWLAGRAAIAPSDILLWGRSIGGAVAVQAAAAQGARGLILERTFTSLPDVAARHYPWLPVRWLMRNRFDSLARIGVYQGPLLQSHGTADEVVPFELGVRLFEAAAAAPKRLVTMVGVTHNGPNSEDYYTELHQFLENLP